MGWIVESLVSFILDVCSGLFIALDQQFSELMKMNGNQTLDFFFTLFMPNAKSGGSTSPMAVFIAIGLMILYMIFLFQLFKNFFVPVTGKAEHPLRLIARMLFFSLLTISAVPICQFIFEIGTGPYEVIDAIEWGPASNPVSDFVEGIGGTVGDLFDGIDFGNILGKLAADLIESLVAIIMLFSILINYFKLVVEIAERYVILGVLSLFSPLCIATGASETTSSIFKSWLGSMFSQVILMCMSTLFLKVFVEALGNLNSLPASQKFVGLVMLLAWLRTGQRIDEHMSTLGLTALRSGGGLWADMFAGARAAGTAARLGSGAAAFGINSKLAGGGAQGRKAAAMHMMSHSRNPAAKALASRMAQNASPELKQRYGNLVGADLGSWGGRALQGQAMGQAAMAKYGDTGVDLGNGHSVTANQLAAQGYQITDGRFDGNNGQIEMRDAHGNIATLSFGTNENGEKFGALTADEGVRDAINDALGYKPKGSENMKDATNATGGEMQGVNDGSFTNKDGLTTDVSSAMDENGNFMTNESGNLIDKEGNELKDANGNAINLSDMQGNLQTGVVMADGTFVPTDQNGNPYQDKAGNLTDENGNIIKGADGNNLTADDIAGHEVGQFLQQTSLADASNAVMAQNGVAGVDSQGFALDAKGNKISDGQGGFVRAADSQGYALDAQGNKISDGQGGFMRADSIQQGYKDGAGKLHSLPASAMNSDGTYNVQTASGIQKMTAQQIAAGGAEIKNGTLVSSDGKAIQGASGAISAGSLTAVGATKSMENVTGANVSSQGIVSRNANGAAINSSGAAVGAYQAPISAKGASASYNADGKAMAIPAGAIANGSGGFLTNDKGNLTYASGHEIKGADGKAIHSSQVTSTQGSGGFAPRGAVVGENGSFKTDKNGNYTNFAGQTLTTPVTGRQSAISAQGAQSTYNSNGVSYSIPANAVANGTGGFMTNAKGNLVNASGQELKGADGGAIHSSQVVSSVGAMGYAPMGATTDGKGAFKTDGAGNYIGQSGSAIVGSAVRADGAQSMYSATDSNGRTASYAIPAGAVANGSGGYRTNEAGNLVNSSGQELRGVGGAAISASQVTSSAGNSGYVPAGAVTDGAGAYRTDAQGNFATASGATVMAGAAIGLAPSAQQNYGGVSASYETGGIALQGIGGGALPVTHSYTDNGGMSGSHVSARDAFGKEQHGDAQFVAVPTTGTIEKNGAQYQMQGRDESGNIMRYEPDSKSQTGFSPSSSGSYVVGADGAMHQLQNNKSYDQHSFTGNGALEVTPMSNGGYQMTLNQGASITAVDDPKLHGVMAVNNPGGQSGYLVPTCFEAPENTIGQVSYNGKPYHFATDENYGHSLASSVANASAGERQAAAESFVASLPGAERGRFVDTITTPGMEYANNGTFNYSQPLSSAQVSTAFKSNDALFVGDSGSRRLATPTEIQSAMSGSAGAPQLYTATSPSMYKDKSGVEHLSENGGRYSVKASYDSESNSYSIRRTTSRSNVKDIIANPGGEVTVLYGDAYGKDGTTFRSRTYIPENGPSVAQNPTRQIRGYDVIDGQTDTVNRGHYQAAARSNSNAPKVVTKTQPGIRGFTLAFSQQKIRTNKNTRTGGLRSKSK